MSQQLHSAESLGSLNRKELQQIAKGLGLKQSAKSSELILSILAKQPTGSNSANSGSAAPQSPAPSFKRFRVLDVFLSSDEDDSDDSGPLTPETLSSSKRHSSRASNASPQQASRQPLHPHSGHPFFATQTSSSLREEGNLLFKSSADLSPVLRRARLNAAKDMYTKAFAAALSDEDRASAQGNIARVYRRLLEMERETSPINSHTDSYLYHASLSIKYGAEPSSKPPKWLLERRLEILKVARDHCLRRDNDKSFKLFIGKLYHSAFGRDSQHLIPAVRLTLLHAILKHHFEEAVRLLEISEHLQSIQQLEDSRRSSIEAESLCRQHPHLAAQFCEHSAESLGSLNRKELLQIAKGLGLKQSAKSPELILSILAKPANEDVEMFAEIEEDLAVLKEDCRLQLSKAHCGQMIFVGDEHLKNAVFGCEDFSTYGVQDALDCYRHAIVHAHEIDLEHEAWAESRLGHAFSQVLKQPATAHVHYRNCVQLALSVYPRRSDSKPWFIEANRAAAEYQEVLNKRDQADIDKRRAPVLEALSAQLGLLKTASRKGASDFLEFLYATYGEGFPARDADNTLRKQLLKAITLFHPDKCGQDDLQKKTLHEEIAKMLNHHYESTKG
jgi:hypothetical protein